MLFPPLRRHSVSSSPCFLRYRADSYYFVTSCQSHPPHHPPKGKRPKQVKWSCAIVFMRGNTYSTNKSRRSSGPDDILMQFILNRFQWMGLSWYKHSTRHIELHTQQTNPTDRLSMSLYYTRGGVVDEERSRMKVVHLSIPGGYFLFCYHPHAYTRTRQD